MTSPATRAQETRREQGFPDRITDPFVLARIAALLDAPLHHRSEEGLPLRVVAAAAAVSRLHPM